MSPLKNPPVKPQTNSFTLILVIISSFLRGLHLCIVRPCVPWLCSKPRKAQTKKHRGRTDGQFWIVRPCVPAGVWNPEKPKQRNTGDTRTDNSELSVGVPSTQKSPNKKTSGTHGRTHGRIADQPMSLQRRCAVHFHRFSSIFEGIFHRFFSVCKGFPKDF